MAPPETKDAAGFPLLGLTNPLNSISDRSWGHGLDRARFKNAISDWSGTPLMLSERNMIAVMDRLTDKPEWTRKVFDEEIVAKWKKEAIEKFKDEPPQKQFSVKMWDYCLAEMREYAGLEKEHGFVPALEATATVFKSDSIIDAQLKHDLRVAASVLEDVPESAKDWHPGSDDMVLDLVHPSLFPLLYGRSRVLKPSYGHVLGDTDGQWEGKGGTMTLDDCEQWIGKGGIMPVPGLAATQVSSFAGLSSWDRWGRANDQHFYSAKFQWLPCEVAFADGDEVKITSYINNLQPKKHKGLYEVLEHMIAKTIPMWNATLDSTQTFHKEPRIDLQDIPWIEPAGERPREEDEGSSDEDTWELDSEWREANRILIPPQPNTYSRREGTFAMKDSREKAVNLRQDWSDQGLQVIVKLANIHLTPEKPDYDGGAWHIEGQLNEHICASALYYYDSDNITDSYLAFRETTSQEYLADKPYEQSDHTHFELLYDIDSDGPCVQELGSTLTREGRLLTFPNVLQHRVSPFSLADKTRPGHRKIVALFLVDPHTRIPSTANVPPQQKEWWKEMVHELDRVNKLPAELQEWVTDSAGDFPLTLEEAKKIRVELMDERRLFVADHETRIEQESFSFCEH
ncbi:hypothetical protein DPSP01_014065 [Paraphaeosphaeria sporulosa]|uniref:Uncharacterized protein n=1 Tax=Paraphaeosphaeria sporulosa TaxID=1460663 RepID=A0A177BUC4_9PLEO|nr:uncharacterized protein CC84DRAFT_1169759 [Paraphaeosphaeria sporulosa]OAF99053.1 hypothetical protein CC84DRAFT_1169759 [Paraphaeosphaeria sporulosa]